ncbi:MAG: 2-keto-4-pentenoate hydratase [Thermodesulfobacteriota bacterium]
MKKFACLSLAVLLAAFLGRGAALAADPVAMELFKQYKAVAPLALASQTVKDLDEAKAYRIQADLAELYKVHGGQISGYKVGLTSKPAQERFKATAPVGGVLFKSMQIADGVARLKGHGQMMLEVEIAYELKQEVTQPVEAAALPGLVAKVMPAVEAPDLKFTDMKSLTANDIIAANVGARAYILGKPVSPDGLDVNAVTGQLMRDGQAVGPAAPGRAALGDQWQALAWTINYALRQGLPVKAGMVFLTGSLGPMYPAQPGQHQAVYTGGLGELSFKVE